MRLAWNHLKRVRPTERPPWTRAARRALRGHRVLSVGCAFVLLSAGVGATTYVKIDGHTRLAAASRTAVAAKSAASAAAGTAAKPGASAKSTASAGSNNNSSSSSAGAAPAPSAAATSAPATATVSNPLTGQPFSGVAQVGAVFNSSNGTPTSHHCTGSVVDSPAGDIVITAAHCVYGTSGQVFVPDYDNGSMPYGVWNVTAVYVAPQWRSDSDPDYDVAFLVVHNANGSSTPIQDVVGGDTLAVDQPYTALTTVIGYPSDTNQPITCTNDTTEFTSTQLQWDCAAYPDGTSGSPFLTDYDPQTGLGTVVGVIGGYETGGDTPDVSYSVHFGDAVTQLLAQAESGSSTSN
jgi:hypothetical protein